MVGERATLNVPLNVETDKGEPDLSEMYPTPPSMDHLHSPGSVTQNSPSNSEASYNESLEIYKNLKNEIHAHNESFRTQLEIVRGICVHHLNYVLIFNYDLYLL